VVSVSDFVRDSYLDRFFPSLAGRVMTIHNGVDARRIAQAVASVDVTAERSRWRIPAGRPVALVIGRLVPVKGHAELLHAVARARDAGALTVRPVLLFVGDGPARLQLEALVQTLALGEDVRFAGTLARVAEPLALADVVLIPSRWEGLPMSLLESMAAGRPTIAVDVGGIREVVVPGTGCIVAAGDHDGLVREMERLLAASPETRRRMGEAARERIKSAFNEEQMVHSYEALLTSVTARRLEAIA
jgi:glycosyltransferase involved in cell wall biosynthesis